MKNVVIILPLLFCSYGLFAQYTFSISYPASPDTADGGLQVVLLSDGYLIGCYSVNQLNGLEYPALLNISLDGAFVWNKSYYWEPYPSDIGGGDPLSVLGQNIFVSCQTNSLSDNLNHQLLCFSPEGDTVWTKIYPGQYQDINMSVIGLLDSNLLIYGNSNTDEFFDQTRLIKVDKSGEVIWDNIYGSEFGSSSPWNVAELPDSSIIMAFAACYPGTQCFFNQYAAITKVDKNGNKLWTKTYNKSEGGTVKIRSWVLPLDEGRLALAWTRDTFHWSVDPYPPIIYFLDSLGNIESEYDGFVRPGNYYMSKLKRMSNGDMLGVGITLDFSDGETTGGWLFRLTQQGELIWERRISDRRYPDLFGQFFDAIETPDGGIIAVGNIATNSFQNAEVWIVKLDSEGCIKPDCTADSIFITPVFEISSDDRKDLYEINPNPANDFISVHISETLNIHEAALEIMDISGRRLGLIGLESHVQTISTSYLSNGIYLVRPLYNGHPMSARKMVILR